ncbi:MAG: hypothetical protein ACTSSK_14340 [Candidatus Heimdallarchaeota archaeon]
MAVSLLCCLGWVLYLVLAFFRLGAIFGVSFLIQEIIDSLTGQASITQLNIKTLFIMLPIVYLSVALMASIMDVILYLFYISSEVLVRKNINNR